LSTLFVSDRENGRLAIWCGHTMIDVAAQFHQGLGSQAAQVEGIDRPNQSRRHVNVFGIGRALAGPPEIYA
jgi:hypothetical protein